MSCVAMVLVRTGVFAFEIHQGDANATSHNKDDANGNVSNDYDPNPGPPLEDHAGASRLDNNYTSMPTMSQVMSLSF